MPICTGGSQPKAGAPVAAAFIGEGIAALIGIVNPWLGLAAGIASPYLVDVGELCATEPPAAPTWTADDAIALLSLGVTPATIIAGQKLQDTITRAAWYNFCECTLTGPPTPPTVVPIPSGWPVVNPTPSDAPVGVSTYVAEVMADNPIEYWRLAESGGRFAHSIAGTQRVPFVCPIASPNPFGHSGPVSDGGSAVMFGGVLQNLATRQFAAAPWSLECWIWPGYNFTSGVGSGRLFTSGTGSYVEIYTGDMGMQVVLNPGANSQNVPINPYAWNHIVITKVGTVCSIYWNGSGYATFGSSGGANLTGPMSWGAGAIGDAVAEVAFYAAELSAARILAHYNAADRRSYRPVWRGSSLAQPLGLTDVSGGLQELRELVTLIQRQEVPFGFVDGTPHPGLTGEGQLTVSGLLGIRVDLTTIPAYVGRIDGTPTVYFDVGYVALGTTTGFQRRDIIRHDPQFIWSGEAGLFTRVGYTFPPGVVATITELLREP
jgi:hypothetical protein